MQVSVVERGASVWTSLFLCPLSLAARGAKAKHTDGTRSGSAGCVACTVGAWPSLVGAWPSLVGPSFSCLLLWISLTLWDGSMGGAALGDRSQFFACLPDDIKSFCWAQSQGQGLTSPFIQPSQEPGEGPDTIHTNQAALREGRTCSAIQPWPSSFAAEPEEAAFRHCLLPTVMHEELWAVLKPFYWGQGFQMWVISQSSPDN